VEVVEEEEEEEEEEVEEDSGEDLLLPLEGEGGMTGDGAAKGMGPPVEDPTCSRIQRHGQ
jgi:hypothetical protein